MVARTAEGDRPLSNREKILDVVRRIPEGRVANYGQVAAMAGLDIERKIFIHINTTNPILLDDSPQRAEVKRQGWEVAYDGMDHEL